MEMRAQNRMIAAGVMSGTSLDGMDMVLAEFEKVETKWSFKVLCAKGITYPKALTERMRKARFLSAEELAFLEHDLSLFWAKHLKVFLDEAKEDCSLIAIHGQTVFHQPEKKLTLQLADLGLIASVTGFPVVGDFRRADLALGGQGAPLVPIGDRYLFGEMAACLNLGGFANVSYFDGDQHLAMDLSVANHLLNLLASELGMEFDMDGRLAAMGEVHPEVLAQLRSLKYFEMSGPKSLGYEWFDRSFLPHWKKLTEDLSLEDRMRTACAHIAERVASELAVVRGELLVTGGGAFNRVLMLEIEKVLPKGLLIKTLTAEEQCLISFKEALVFAFLGVLRFRGENNIIAGITGASRDHCAGLIALP